VPFIYSSVGPSAEMQKNLDVDLTDISSTVQDFGGNREGRPDHTIA